MTSIQPDYFRGTPGHDGSLWCMPARGNGRSEVEGGNPLIRSSDFAGMARFGGEKTVCFRAKLSRTGHLRPGASLP